MIHCFIIVTASHSFLPVACFLFEENERNKIK